MPQRLCRAPHSERPHVRDPSGWGCPLDDPPAGGLRCFVCASVGQRQRHHRRQRVAFARDGGTTFFARQSVHHDRQRRHSDRRQFDQRETRATNQINFEGRPDINGTATLPTTRTSTSTSTSGAPAIGSLTINGGTELRDMNLIIGDSDTLPGSPILAPRHRAMFASRIQARSSTTIPSFCPSPFYPTGHSPSINDRTVEPGATDRL